MIFQNMIVANYPHRFTAWVKQSIVYLRKRLQHCNNSRPPISLLEFVPCVFLWLYSVLRNTEMLASIEMLLTWPTIITTQLWSMLCTLEKAASCVASVKS
ncbi:hypothetical protein T4C_7107 [Trichinella pseudospiralis]|uniref:Uncharacterized protein n=1 Tax=Trichinella pseudospiralis TaxID=6337 RepID=A0A0V1GJQ4_TRIPS|nr:hypothetical protein T4C_7107 [Trichinella pseudospiralis]